jgi:hypothetical protein
MIGQPLGLAHGELVAPDNVLAAYNLMPGSSQPSSDLALHPQGKVAQVSLDRLTPI